METTLNLLGKRRGKFARDCTTLDELKSYIGARWELLEPDKALEELKRPDGVIKVRER